MTPVVCGCKQLFNHSINAFEYKHSNTNRNHSKAYKRVVSYLLAWRSLQFIRLASGRKFLTLLDNASDMMIRRLASRASLDSDDHAAIRSLPFKPQVFKKQALLVEEGQKPILCPFILSGFTFVQKITSAGMRQIVSFQIPVILSICKTSSLKYPTAPCRH